MLAKKSIKYKAVGCCETFLPTYVDTFLARLMQCMCNICVLVSVGSEIKLFDG